tara:strand:- start:38 stop:472 length:435 start_codon:yes stop_codon:yes gene_type:complete
MTKTIQTKPLSKEMPLTKYASIMSIDSKEEKYILDNEVDTHYENNSALPESFLCLSYPVYDGDYYFSFIADSVRVNAQYNAKANRKLRELSKTFLNADQIFDEMQDYFEMQFKDAGSGDTMTREELWASILDITSKREALVQAN